MKFIPECKNLIKASALIAGFVLSNTASANLINADFSDGLNGWTGSVQDTGTLINDVNFADYTDIFSTSAGSVTLATTFDIDQAFLFQNVTFGNNVSELSLNFAHSDPDFTFDAFNIVLSETTTGFNHNFVNDGNTVDISSLVGLNSLFEISLVDLDFIDETFTVSDISISTVSVPEPSSFAVFALGLLALRQRMNKNKNI